MTYIPFKENNEGEVMWTEQKLEEYQIYLQMCPRHIIKRSDFETKTFLDVYYSKLKRNARYNKIMNNLTATN